jgi:hypothetical protein
MTRQSKFGKISIMYTDDECLYKFCFMLQEESYACDLMVEEEHKVSKWSTAIQLSQSIDQLY